jgi:hypothetical protein
MLGVVPENPWHVNLTARTRQHAPIHRGSMWIIEPFYLQKGDNDGLEADNGPIEESGLWQIATELGA